MVASELNVSGLAFSVFEPLAAGVVALAGIAAIVTRDRNAVILS